MKKKILAMVLMAVSLSGSALAEQPKAEEYRNMIAKGTYYVEYENLQNKAALAVQGEKRMAYISANQASGLNFLPIVSLFSQGSSKLVPSVLYRDGNYYQFNGKKNAIMAKTSQLSDPNINPREGWDYVKAKLTVPDELAVFAPNSAIKDKYGLKIPKYVESGEAVIDDKPYSYDKYVSSYNSGAGTVLFENILYMYYRDGELKLIRHSKLDGSGETELERLKVIKLTADLPESAFVIPQGCKVYGAGLGDMNDLIEKPILVEEYSKKEVK